MALPTTLAVTKPLGTDSIGEGDDQIRALKQFIADIFGIPTDPTQITAAPFSISAAGYVAVMQGLNFNNKPLNGLPAPVDPSDAARKAEMDTKLATTGGTITGSLVMYAAQPTIYVEDTASGAEWAVQSNTNLLFYYNTGTHGAPIWTQRYSLNLSGTPVDATNLTSKGYVDTRDNALISDYSSRDTAVITALTVGTGSNPPAAIIPLRTALGSATVLNAADGDVAQNDFSFAPHIVITGGGSGVASHRLETAIDLPDDGSVNGRFRLVDKGGAGDATVVRWRYVTASDDPTIWVAYDGAGLIVGAWASDDPVPGPSPAVSISGCTATMFKSADLSQLTISEASLTQADAKIAQENWNPANRLYRGLQIEANDMAPAGWIQKNCKVVGGELVVK